MSFANKTKQHACSNETTTTNKQTTAPPLSVQIMDRKRSFLKETQNRLRQQTPVADTYTWKFNGTSSLPAGVTEQLISGQTGGGSGIDILHIKNLTESTFGTYTCAATVNGYTTEQSHFIGILAEKPVVNIIKPPVSSSFAIQCQVTGYPAPNIQWDFIPKATSHVHQNNNHGLPHDVQALYETYQSTLFVNKYVPVDHTGRWYCKASNAAGTAV
ncbi:MAM domain-containing glycosylphosphatidylinositol anchor protein 2-like [Ruditapes philippinarum]|uniref:MAM domain-containing glycosylphosphatidylinositol anchor protein 2-like n=1 Tax=Ruditapes philippinarum TaxID=129788 RepID=UPI00295B30FE|nr:MAM domain-containing glycosylphosphatidylinositol anchor protein 2-like [Ruditapes philippinarum]